MNKTGNGNIRSGSPGTSQVSRDLVSAHVAENPSPKSQGDKVKMQSPPKRSRPESLMSFFRPRSSVEGSKRRSLDPTAAAKEVERMNRTLHEALFFVGNEESRKTWDDDERRAHSGKASAKTPSKPGQPAAESRGPNAPLADQPPPPPLGHQTANPEKASKPGQPADFAARPLPPGDQPPPLPSPRQTSIPEKAADKTLSKPVQPADLGTPPHLPNDLRAQRSPAPPLVPCPLPPPPENTLRNLLSLLGEKAPTSALDMASRLPPQPSITVKPSSEPQSLLPADVPVNDALKSLKLTPPNEKSRKTESDFSRLAAALNNASDLVRPYAQEVTEAKKQLASADKGQLGDAQTRLRVAESWHAVATKCLSEYAAGRLDTSATQREVKIARERVDGLEARLKSKTEDSNLVKRLLEGARTELRYAEMQAETIANADQWKPEVPVQHRQLADVLAKLTLVVDDRNAWLLRLSKDITPEELHKLQAAAQAPGAQIGPRSQLMLNELVEGVVTGNEVKVKGAQKEIQQYLGENGTLLTSITDALTVLSNLTGPEANDLRNDLTRLLAAVQDPEAGLQQLLRIGQADPKQVMKLGKQLWKPAD